MPKKKKNTKLPKAAIGAVLSMIPQALKLKDSMAEGVKSFTTTDELGNMEDTAGNILATSIASSMSPLNNIKTVLGDESLTNKDKFKFAAANIVPGLGGFLYAKKQIKQGEQRKENYEVEQGSMRALSNLQNYQRNKPTFANGGEIPEGENIEELARKEEAYVAEQTKIDSLISDTLARMSEGKEVTPLPEWLQKAAKSQPYDNTCIGNATECYMKGTGQQPIYGNKLLYGNPSKYGFRMLEEGEKPLPGDIGQAYYEGEEEVLPYHSWVYDKDLNEVYADGSGGKTLKKTTNYWTEKKVGGHNVFRYTGDQDIVNKGIEAINLMSSQKPESMDIPIKENGKLPDVLENPILQMAFGGSIDGDPPTNIVPDDYYSSAGIDVSRPEFVDLSTQGRQDLFTRLIDKKETLSPTELIYRDKLQEASMQETLIPVEEDNLPVKALGGNLPQNPNKRSHLPVDNIQGEVHEKGGTNIGDKVEAERGETKVADYIFSDRLKITKKDIEDYNLPSNYKGKTFADISKSIEKTFSKREGDSYDDEEKEIQLTDLREMQETQRQQITQSGFEGVQDRFVKALGGFIDDGLSEEDFMSRSADLLQGELAKAVNAAGYSEKELDEFKGTPNKLIKMFTGGLVPENELEIKGIEDSTQNTSYWLNQFEEQDLPLSNESYTTYKDVTKGVEEQPGVIGNQITPIPVTADKTTTLQPSVIRSDKALIDNTVSEEAAENLVSTEGVEAGGTKASQVLLQAGNLFDIARGTLEAFRPQKKFDRVEPQEITPGYLDPNQQLAQTEKAFSAAEGDIETATSDAGSILAARLGLVSKEGDVKANILADYENKNVAIENQAKMFNAQARSQAANVNVDQQRYEEMVNQQRKDVASNMVQAGLSNAAEIYAGQVRDKRMEDVQSKVVKMLGTADFDWSEDLTHIVAKDHVTGQDRKYTVEQMMNYLGVTSPEEVRAALDTYRGSQ